MKKRLLKKLAACLVCLFPLAVSGQYPFRDTSLSVQQRLDDLLSRLTFEEKVSLLTETAPPVERLGIPKYYHGNEALHGIVRPGRFTVFPQAIALAATWNPELIGRVASAASDEARGRWNELGLGQDQTAQYSDLLTFWSPTVNMARDPRWGRTPETYGEDPFLSGEIGSRFVRGLQGDDPRYLKVVSTPKHFVANNEEHNRFECQVTVSERNLRDYYLPAFEACIREGKAESIMTAYPAVNGVPCTANAWLLDTVLRGEWGFGGYVVSDCAAASNIYDPHHYTATPEEAAAAAIKAGLDLECGYNHVYKGPLVRAVRQGLVTGQQIDSAVYRVLRARMRLGLFDPVEANPYNRISPSVVGCPEHKALALETARQSMVLLKNDGILPLDLSKIKSIAVVGINADRHEFGDYSGIPLNAPVSVLEGLQARFGGRVKIVHVPWVSESLDGYETVPAEAFGEGLRAEYYSNTSLEGTPKVRIDRRIDLEPVNQAPDPFLPKSPFSVRWTGQLVPPVTGRYTIGFTSDDGCRLYLNGDLAVDSWHKRSAVTDEVTVDLEAGKPCRITAEYFDDGGEAVARLKWKAPVTHEKPAIERFGEAGRVAAQCDLTVAVLGINKNIEREGLDRTRITLPDDQQTFIEEIMKVNPRTVVVLVAGSSLAINEIDEKASAVLNAWYPGEQGGTAVAEALAGDYSPAGRLPLTYYNSLDELPPFDDYAIEKGRTYQYFKGKPLYPFGYGLSYSSFAYDKMKVRADGKRIVVSFDLTNTGAFDADEVAQVYVHLPIRGKYEPVKQLKGFERVSLKKGETKRVSIEIDPAKLRFYDEGLGRYVTPTGEYLFMLGASSEDIRLSRSLKL